MNRDLYDRLYAAYSWLVDANLPMRREHAPILIEAAEELKKLKSRYADCQKDLVDADNEYGLLMDEIKRLQVATAFINEQTDAFLKMRAENKLLRKVLWNSKNRFIALGETGSAKDCDDALKANGHE